MDFAANAADLSGLFGLQARHSAGCGVLNFLWSSDPGHSARRVELQ